MSVIVITNQGSPYYNKTGQNVANQGSHHKLGQLLKIGAQQRLIATQASRKICFYLCLLSPLRLILKTNGHLSLCCCVGRS